MSRSSYQLALETRAMALLRERIIAEYGEDVELIRDTIEGASDLNGLIASAATELAFVEGVKAGIEQAIDKLKVRLTRYCNQAQTLRNGIAAAMETAELTSFKTPTATFSMRTSPPRVEITDASEIPAIYLTQPAPVPDKRAISAALKENQSVPGAVLSNQPPALSVRFT